MDFNSLKIEFFNKPSKDTISIRETVFVKEQCFLDEFDEKDNTSIHILIKENEKPVATARFYKQDNNVWVVGRFAVMREYRNMGAGRYLMEQVESKIISLGGKNIELSAQLQAQGFYESLGYKAEGDIYYDQHAKHIHMVKKI